MRRSVFSRPEQAVMWSICFAAVLSVHFSLHAGAQEQPEAPANSASPVFARVVRVDLPLVGSADNRVKSQISQFLSDAPSDGGRPILVLEFRDADPNREAASTETTEFERAYSLARFLSSDELSRVRTIAYIPERVAGHAALVVMACEEIAMAPKAVLETGSLPLADAREMAIQQAYESIAKRRLTIPPALAAGILDRSLEISRVETPNGVQYMQAAELADARSQNLVNAVETVKRANEPLRLEGDYLRLKLPWSATSRPIARVWPKH